MVHLETGDGGDSARMDGVHAHAHLISFFLKLYFLHLQCLTYISRAV